MKTHSLDRNIRIHLPVRASAKATTHRTWFHRLGALVRRRGLLLAGAVVLATTCAAAAGSSARWTNSGGLVMREAYDDNVFLQDVGSLAGRGSWVTSLQAQAGTVFVQPSGFEAALSYTPEAVFYHDETGENHVIHRAAVNLSGAPGGKRWDIQNALTWIDGASENLVFTGRGGPPAAGGVALRERRDAFVYRGNAKATFETGGWYARPSATVYMHDFRSRQSTAAGYQNYADRSDVSGGIEVGRKLGDRTAVSIACRYGRQEQEQLFDTGPAYDNTYRRVLASVETVAWDWLKISAQVGPDFRDFGSLIAAGAAERPTYFYADVSLTATPRKGEQVTLLVKQYAQPGFGGRSIYDDLTWEAKWRRVVNDRWTFTAGLRAYNTGFFAPVLRDDWIYTASLEASWAFRKNWNLTGSWMSEAGESRVPDTPAREFRHTLVSFGLRCNFR